MNSQNPPKSQFTISEELKESICRALATDKKQVCSFNVLQPDFLAMPKTLKEISTWVLWSGKEIVTDKTGEVRLNKIPINANRYPQNAKTSDPATWTSFDLACATYKQNHGKPDNRLKGGILSGIGFVLADGQGIVGIDIDHCVKPDGTLEDFAIPLLHKLKNTYCEVSPSGTGIRAFVFGVKKQGGNRSRNVEIYSQGRYMTVTGRTIGSKSDIAADQSIIDFFQAYIDQPKTKKADKPKQATISQTENAYLDDAAIFDKIRNQKNQVNAKSFIELFDNGAISAYDNDDSRAEMALAGILCFWFGPNPADIDKAMRQSALLQSEDRLKKWDKKHYSDGKTYGQGTIEKALKNHNGEFYKDRKVKSQKKQGKTNKPEAKPNSNLPTIQYSKGELMRCFNELQNALFYDVYQRDGKLVQIIRISKHKKKGAIVRQAGSTIIDLLTLSTCKFLADKYANWEVWDANADDFKLSNAPKIVIETLLAGTSDWRFRVLEGMVNCPVMRPDGSILENPGYDDETGLYADFDKGQFPPVALDANEKNYQKLLVIATKGLDIIKDALDEFPFKDDPSRSVAIAAILTAVMRQCVPSAPLFAFSAPTPGTGKSALADLVSIIATGLQAAAVNFSPDKVEMEKAFFAILLEGAPVVLVDNIVGKVNSPSWNSILSQGEIKGRILGLSKTGKASTQALWLATGNNLQLVGDMTRRSLFCELDAGVERPAERKFSKDIFAWAKENRGELVKGALTILQAYQLAGRPCQDKLKPMNGFNEWSAIVRGPIVWLGFPDPIETQRIIEAEDPERAAIGAVFAALWDVFGDKPFEAREVANPTKMVADESKTERLTEAVNDAIISPKGVNSKTVGNWLAKYKGKIVDGFQLTSKGKIARLETWQIVQKA